MTNLNNFRIIEKYIRYANINSYTYQLNSSKGLQVVLKGIEPSVPPQEISDALAEKGFAVVNIINRNKVVQPLFKIELQPDVKHVKIFSNV